MKILNTLSISAVAIMLGVGPVNAAEWSRITLFSADFAADNRCEIVSSALAPDTKGMVYASFWHCDYETDQWGHDYRCFDYISTPNRAGFCEGVIK